MDPVPLVEPVPAGLLMHEAVGHRLEGSRLLSSGEGQTFKDSVGQAILPEPGQSLRLTLDQTGDCFKFTDHLLQKCRELGVDFRFNTDIRSLNIVNGQISSVSTSAGNLSADAYVMALGSYSTRLLKQVGIDSPVYPVKGYSITLPVINPQAAPVSTIMDETYKVALTRLGDRIRVALVNADADRLLHQIFIQQHKRVRIFSGQLGRLRCRSQQSGSLAVQEFLHHGAFVGKEPYLGILVRLLGQSGSGGADP